MNKLKIFLINNYYLATAPLIFLSFPSYDLAPLKIFPLIAWFSMIPLFLYISGKPMKEVFFITFITGLAGNFLTYGWIGNFGAKVQGGYLVIVMLLIPSITAMFTIKIVVAEYLSRKFPGYRIFFYPSVWIIIDFVHSIGFLAFPWAYIGYSQYTFTPFIQAASVTGILGINFIIILFNIIASGFLGSLKNDHEGTRRITGNPYFTRLAAILLIIATVTVAGGIRLSKNSGEGNGRVFRIAIVQSCISPWENWTGNRFRYLAELMYYTKLSLRADPDFIIWSESATLETLSFRSFTGETDIFDQQLSGFVKENGKPMLTGEIGVTVKRDGYRLKYYPQNNAVLINGSGEVVQTYPKINLVPFGEWFPYEKWFHPLKLLLDSFGASDFVPGKTPELFRVDGLRFGSLICYEGIFFRLCRNYRNMGADFMINITNDGWTDSYSGHYQHFSASVFRSIENGIWMVRAGNTGVTAIIDPKGRIVNSIPILKKTYMNGEIDTSKNIRTFYSSYGDIILYVSMLFIMVFMFKIIVGHFRGERGADQGIK